MCLYPRYTFQPGINKKELLTVMKEDGMTAIKLDLEQADLKNRWLGKNNLNTF